jgi:excisionase family DNA binding protein
MQIALLGHTKGRNYKEMKKKDELYFNVPVADKPLLRVDEAAELTGLSAGYLLGLIEGNKIAFLIIEDSYRIKRFELNRFIQELK